MNLSSKGNLKAHIELIHDKNHEPLKCPMPSCNGIYNAKRNLVIHLRKHHFGGLEKTKGNTAILTQIRRLLKKKRSENKDKNKISDDKDKSPDDNSNVDDDSETPAKNTRQRHLKKHVTKRSSSEKEDKIGISNGAKITVIENILVKPKQTNALNRSTRAIRTRNDGQSYAIEKNNETEAFISYNQKNVQEINAQEHAMDLYDDDDLHFANDIVNEPQLENKCSQDWNASQHAAAAKQGNR